jgi:hypothetical protein
VSGSAGSAQPTRTARLVAALVVAEGLALGMLALVYAGFLIAGHPHNRTLALFGAALGLVAGAGLVVAGRALRLGRRAAYSPTLLAQLLAIPVGIGRAQGHQPLAAVAVLLPAVVTIALLVGTRDGRSIASS